VNRIRGLLLLFASLLGLWLLLDSTLARGAALAVVGVVAAGVVAMIFACGLAFLSCFRVSPSGFAAALLCITDFAKGLAKGNSTGMEGARLRKRMLVHRTQGKEP
jgi:hypothetical protein